MKPWTIQIKNAKWTAALNKESKLDTDSLRILATLLKLIFLSILIKVLKH